MPFDNLPDRREDRPERPSCEIYWAIVRYLGRDPSQEELRQITEAICLGIKRGFDDDA